MVPGVRGGSGTPSIRLIALIGQLDTHVVRSVQIRSLSCPATVAGVLDRSAVRARPPGTVAVLRHDCATSTVPCGSMVS